MRARRRNGGCEPAGGEKERNDAKNGERRGDEGACAFASGHGYTCHPDGKQMKETGLQDGFPVDNLHAPFEPVQPLRPEAIAREQTRPVLPAMSR